MVKSGILTMILSAMDLEIISGKQVLYYFFRYNNCL